MKHTIKDTLLLIGMQPNLLGFSYIVYAEEILLENKSSFPYLIKEIYKKIAERYNTTPSAVERCIRHAISVTWSCTTTEETKKMRQKLFSNTKKSAKKVPTNSQLIFRLYFYFIDSSESYTIPL